MAKKRAIFKLRVNMGQTLFQAENELAKDYCLRANRKNLGVQRIEEMLSEGVEVAIMPNFPLEKELLDRLVILT